MKRDGSSLTLFQKQRVSLQTAYQVISDSLDASTSTQLPGDLLTMGGDPNQQEPQQISGLSERFVTKNMAQVPGISKAQLEVRMVGQEDRKSVV